MKIFLHIICSFFAFGLIVNAQDMQGKNFDSLSVSTNTFSVNKHDIWDEIGDEQLAYGSWVLNGIIMPELLPASQDTNDMWGAETNGFQLSIRVPGKEYTAGGMVPVITVLRNLEEDSRTLVVTSSPSLFLSFKIYLGTNECIPKPEKIQPPWAKYIPVTTSEPAPPKGYRELEFGPRNEKISELYLSSFFDSGQPGDYSVRAICQVFSPTNKALLYEISSGIASFRLLPKPSSAGSTNSTP